MYKYYIVVYCKIYHENIILYLLYKYVVISSSS